MHVYEIKFVPSHKLAKDKIKVDLKLNEIKRLSIEKQFSTHQNTSHLLATSDFLGRIEQLEVNIEDVNSLDEFVEKVEINYLSHSSSRLVNSKCLIIQVGVENSSCISFLLFKQRSQTL